MGIFDFLKPKKEIDSVFNHAFKEMSDSIGEKEFKRITEQAYNDMKSGKIVNLSEVIAENVSKERLSQVSRKMNSFQDETAKLIKESFGYEQGSPTDEDVIPEGFGRFGLDPTNPVPVDGIGGGYEYLADLKDRKGHSIIYARVGSMSVENINGLIDEYEIFDSINHKICNLYLAPYNSKNSKKRPSGLY